ncbi:MAG: FHA domain-containing protein [Coriobacteriia bacterium]|nr:FHA domain-containing protein [Coriobacteriia bacterium]
MSECPACGIDIDPSATECSSCGAVVSGTTASFAPVGSPDQAPVAGEAAAEGPVLVVRKGPQPGERFFIDRPRLSIGRDPESDVFLNDMTVSRLHAVVEMIGTDVRVTDSGSLNGTYVNGVLVDTAELDNGDALQIGTFQMVFFSAVEGGS